MCFTYKRGLLALLQVTITGTPRQCTEAWAIVKAVLERYPVVEAFMVHHPPPPPSLDETAAAALSGESWYSIYAVCNRSDSRELLTNEALVGNKHIASLTSPLCVSRVVSANTPPVQKAHELSMLAAV